MKRVIQALLVMSIVLSFEAQSSSGRTRKQKCIGTIFGGPKDKWAGKIYHCLKIPTKTVGIRGVAMRYVPCGTKIRITNLKNGKTTIAPVIDRGPYGALLGDGEPCPKQAKRCYTLRNGKKWYVKLRRRWPGKWRGCLDMTNTVADEIGHNGLGYVKIEYIRSSRRKRPST